MPIYGISILNNNMEVQNLGKGSSHVTCLAAFPPSQWHT